MIYQITALILGIFYFVVTGRAYSNTHVAINWLVLIAMVFNIANIIDKAFN